MHEHLHGVRRDAAHILLVLLADLLDEVLDEKRDVIGAVAQRRQDDRDDVESVVEVIAERAFADHRLEVAVRRRDDAHIDVYRLLATDAVELLLLQDAQELDLQVLVELSDLVEEDRAVVGELELAELAPHRTCEGAFLVAEELRFEQGAGDGAAVDADERATAPAARVVDALRDDLLARAALAADQDVGRRVGRLRGERQHIDDLAALADVVGKSLCRLLRAQELLLEVLGLGRDLREALHQRLDLCDVLDDRHDTGNLAIDEDRVDIGDDRRAILLVADAADARDARAQHGAAVAVGSRLEDVLSDDHLRRLVDDAQIRWIDIGDLAAAVDDADAVLHRLEDHLQALLHQGILVQQLVDPVDLRGFVHDEVALEEAHHLDDGLPPVVPLRRHEDRVALCDLEGHELHEAVHLTALTALAADVEVAVVALAEFLRALHDHRRDARMDAAFVVDDGFPFKYHFHRSFLLAIIIL